MARSNGAMTNGGWPPQHAPNGEPDPRTYQQGQYPQQQQRPPQQGGYPPQQHARPQQPAPGAGGMYPPAGYPEQQPAAQPGYDPQQAYHYPQQAQPAPVTAPPRPRQNGLNGLQPPQPQQGYGGYAQPQPQSQPPQGYGAPRQPQQQAPNYAPVPNTQPPQRRQQPAPQQARQPNPGFRQGNGAADYGARPAAPEPRTAPPRYDQWPPAPQAAPAPQPARTAPKGFGAPQQDMGGYDLGSYMPAGHQADGLPQDLMQGDPLQQQAPWMHPAQGDFSEAAMAQAFEQGFDQGFPAGDLDYDQGQGGALEPTYNQEEAAEYEYEERKRGSWVLRIAGAVVVAIGLGYGLAQGYKLVAGGSSDGETPVVHSDAAPARTKPSDPGGREFAHTDSKIMGRLGDGSSEADTSSDGGTRRVQTVQVGRDGAIVPPAAPVENASSSSVSVPGVTMIDGFGGSSYGGSVVTTAPEPPQPPQQTASTSQPIVVNPPKSSAPPTPSAKPEVIAKVTPTKTTTSTAKKKVTTAAVDTSAGSGANGYVVVLASVPASSNSRLDALKKFADMQQTYGSVLMNKTPDVREANLGDRGTYHRLLVGPPSSRSQASQLCTQLKASGYKDCWVMAY